MEDQSVLRHLENHDFDRHEQGDERRADQCLFGYPCSLHPVSSVFPAANLLQAVKNRKETSRA